MKFTLVLAAFAATTFALPQGGPGFGRGGNAPQGQQGPPGQQGQQGPPPQGQQGQQGPPPQGQQGQASAAPPANPAATASAAPAGQSAAPPAAQSAAAAPPAQSAAASAASAPPASASGAAPAQSSAATANNANNAANAAASSSGSSTGASSGTQGPVDPAQVPDFGVTAGQNEENGSCDGSVPGVKIPCACPPSKDAFIPKLNEFLADGQVPDGTKISFPTSDSVQDQITRAMVTLNVLQNFSGQSGMGCPASATTLLAQIMALQGQL